MDYDIDKLVQEFEAATDKLRQAQFMWDYEQDVMAAQALGAAQERYKAVGLALAHAVVMAYADGGRVVPSDSTDSTQ